MIHGDRGSGQLAERLAPHAEHHRGTHPRVAESSGPLHPEPVTVVPGRVQLMKLLYKPFAIIAKLISARLGKSIFKGLWSTIDDRQPPGARTADATAAKVVGAAALEAATMAGVAAAVDRASARTFH